MMMLVAVALIGVLLGLRFSSLILAPTSAMCFAFAIAYGVGQEVGVWATLLLILSTLTSLQVGYLLGSATLFLSMRHRAAGADRTANATTTHSAVH